MSSGNLTAPPATSAERRVLADETPVRPKSTSHANYRATDLTTARQAMMKDLGPYVPEISLPDFEKFILPPLPQGLDVMSVRRSLEKSRQLSATGFRAMVKDATTQAAREPAYFMPLQDIHKEIRKAAKPLLREKLVLEYRVCGDSKPLSDRDSTSRPDGYEILARRNPIHSGRPEDNYLDIPRCDEYKKGKSYDDLVDNIGKVCWSAHHILRNDARRRFVYGLTIEKTTARIWFFNRQAVIVSEPFDYMTESDHFIHLVLAMSFAEPTKLGYDTTMKYCWDKKSKSFDYEIHFKNKIYRTTRIISDYSADALRGRGTRVFEAVEVQNNKKIGQPVVIKDTWTDHDRDNEGTIMEKMLAAATDEQKRYFLTVLDHGYVESNNQDDNTHTVHLRGLDISRHRKGELLIHMGYTQVPKIKNTRSQGLPAEFNVPTRITPLDYEYSPKIHYRMVFKEVCRPLDDECKWTEVFRVLSEAVQGIRIMFELGRWVHRDLSPANILIDGDQVKLADLEFAKLIGTVGTRTGTLDFMSCEVQALQYLFQPEERESIAVPEPDLFNDSTVSTSSKKPGEPPFVHHSLHDLESLWWIFMRFLFWYVPTGVKFSVNALESQREFAETALFPRILNYGDRLVAFSKRTGFYRLKSFLAYDLNQTVLLEQGNTLRRKILNAFQLAEKALEDSGEVNYTHFPDVFNSVQEAFEEGVKLDGLDGYKLVHLAKKLNAIEQESAVGKQPTHSEGSVNDKGAAPDQTPAADDRPIVSKRKRVSEGL